MNDNFNVDGDEALVAGRGDATPRGVCPICNSSPCIAVNHHFGVCPICHRTDGYLNVRNDHWFVCNEHKTKWVIGANLFSSCMDETPEQQRAEQEGIGFASYEKVKPYYGTDAPWPDDEEGGMSLEELLHSLDSDVESVERGDLSIKRPEGERVSACLLAMPSTRGSGDGWPAFKSF